MSKPAHLQKQSSVPRNSAWSKGPPPLSTTPSRSHSPAPTTPVFSHSRRPSTLSGVNIKDGVAVPRNNPGAAKQASVSFGSIDNASAAISSSPASAPAIKTEGVKSFGTIEAESPVNGKATLSSRPSAAASTSATNSTTSTPAVSVATPTPSAAKLAKTDIAKLFQNPSSAPSSQPPSDTSSPSLRSSTLPPAQQPSSSSQPTPSTASSQPSQLGSHSYTPYRHPQPNSQPTPRSPAYPQRPLANGSGPRGQGGPNGAPSANMPSPRLNPHPHNGQPSGMPPPPQMQPMMQWNQPYYFPGMPDPHGYYAGYYMPPGPPPHHPPPGGPHGPPHTGMPISPRNPPIPLQGPGTPTLSHATASAVHPPLQAPPLSHPSTSIGSVSSPPPTPSTSRLNVASTAFVPQVSTSRPKVTLKNADGVEVKLGEIIKPTASPANNATTNGRPPIPVFRQPSPGTLNRRSVRLESPEQQAKRLEEERVKLQAEEKAKKEKEDQERQKKEKEERKQREEEDKKKKEEEEEKERLRKEEEEKERLRKEEEEKERIRIEEEEKERLRIEEAERLRKEEEERKVKEEEEEQKRKVEEEEQKRKVEEEERKRLEEKERERARKEEEEEKVAKAKLAEAEAKSKEDAAVETPEEGEITVPEVPKEKTKESLRINTSESLKKRPGPLDLSGTASVSEPLPSALATARIIDDIRNVQYPEGIASPKPELNANAQDGKFRYDRDFLLQFMAICKEKPEMLPPLDAIGLEPIDQAALGMSRSVSGRHRQASGSGPPSRQTSIGLGIGPSFPKSTSINPFNGGMGNFSHPKHTSEERFRQSNDRSASVSGPMPFSGGRPVGMQRSASQGGPGGPVSTHRTRSQRGSGKRDKMPPAQQNTQSHYNQQPLSFEPVVPLKATENRWDRKSIQVESDSPEMVDRKVKGLLNKLTMERFDSISDQIIQWANKSEKEKDGRTLIQVIRLVFEKATDEAAWSEMYARLCRKMMEQISTNVQDDGIKGSDGKPIAGGQLFRKYLLNRCQEDFERGWFAKEATAAAAANKAKDDQAVKAANEKNKDENADEEVALYSEEYYAAQKAKRQGLGLIKFIGELFKLQMLTERIMHECVKKLLGNVSNPEEEEIESLCKLLSTVGQLLDTVKAHAHMDVYFSRMKELTTSQNVSSRMQFMLQDVIELRNRGWIARNAVAVPATIAQIHETAAKEKAAQEKDYSQRQASMSRGGSRRGGDRGDHQPANPEGWAVAGSAARPPPKAGDLSQFGKINKALPTTFGPGSVFAGKKAIDKRESLSRTSSSSNMFHMLQADASADKAAEAAPQRKRLNLLPRSKPAESEAQQQESSEEEEVSTPTTTAEMSEEAATKKIAEDSKEFFGVRNLDEAEVYFTALPSQHHHRLVEKLVNTAVESKEADAKLVSEFFERAVSKNLCTPTAFEEGLVSLAEIIDDVAIDAPKAFDLFAIMIKGAGLDEERRSRLASKSMDSDKLLAKLS